MAGQALRMASANQTKSQSSTQLPVFDNMAAGRGESGTCQAMAMVPRSKASVSVSMSASSSATKVRSLANWRVIADGARRLWLSSNKGLSSVAREELLALVEGRVGQVAPSTFGVAEGMRSRECNGGIQPAGWRSADGRLWFPTVRGVAVVDPGWVDAREERVATYTDLPPGQFRFELQARIGGGPWGEPAALEIERRPGLVERRWFWPGLVMLVAALGLAGFGLAGFGLRLRRLRANEVELQRRVDQAIGDLKRLEGMLPVCAWCKTARRDPAYWTRIETWLQEHDRADVTHARCPDCQARYFPGGGRDGT